MKNLHLTAARWLALTVGCALALLAQSSAHATTVTPYFTNLVSELHSRSTALTGTTDKVAKAQKKTIDSALQSIATAHGLALTDDLKLASTVTKSLAKSFASEFTPAGVPTPPGTHALGKLTSTLVSNLAHEVTADLNDLNTQISALPDGAKKTGFEKSATALQLKLNAALGATPAAAEAAALATVETGILSLGKIVAKAANSGGGGGGGTITGHGLTCKINGVTFTALGAGGVFVSQTGELAVTGGTLQKTVTVIAANVTGPGDYPTVSSIVQDIGAGVAYTSNVTGTIHIATFNLAAKKASGTFSFTASQSTPTPNPNNVVNVTQGSFNITTIVSSPN